MRKSRFSESQILAILAEGEAGVPVAEICRKHGISNPTYYQWKSKYAWMSVNELKRMYADLALEMRRSTTCWRENYEARQLESPPDGSVIIGTTH